MRVIQLWPRKEWLPPLIKFNSSKHHHPLQTLPQESHFQVVVLILNFELEWFSVECRKTKTKVITLANHKEHTQYSEPIKTRSNYR